MNMRRAGGSTTFIDQLEDRRLLAIVPLGGGFQLNSTTSNPEFSVIASDSKGNYVSVWEEPAGDSPASICAQRFNPKGKAIGKAFQVSVDSTQLPVDPAIAMNSKGSFVIVWETRGDADSAIRARRFSSTGAAQGGEIVVAAQDGAYCTDPAVATNSKGQFTITWTTPDGDGNGVFARQYSAKGVAANGGFKINSYVAGEQANSAVAQDSKGQAIITWQSANQDGSGQGIFGQRIDSKGKFVGAEFRANANRKGNQQLPAVSVNSKGTFLITWTTDRQDGDGYGIVARKFDAKGSAREAEFQVNTVTSGNQICPAVATSSRGEFVIAWADLREDGSLAAMSARKYDTAGKAKSDQFNATESIVPISQDTLFTLEASGTISTAHRLFISPGISTGARFLYNGDLNYDGVVNRLDLDLLAQNWLKGSAVSTGTLNAGNTGAILVRTTYTGDLNLDGIVNVTDLYLLATNWQAGSGQSTVSIQDASVSGVSPISAGMITNGQLSSGATASYSPIVGNMMTIAKFRGANVISEPGTLYQPITGVLDLSGSNLNVTGTPYTATVTSGVLDVSGLSSGSGVLLGTNQRLIHNGVVENSGSVSSGSVIVDDTASIISQSPSPEVQPSIDSAPPPEAEVTPEPPPAPPESTPEPPPPPPEAETVTPTEG